MQQQPGLYQHKWHIEDQTGNIDASANVPWKPGKAVCVVRNYPAHAKELAQPIPKEPIFFLKPLTSMKPLSSPIQLPASHYGVCHHELELVLLVGETISQMGPEHVMKKIVGYGIGLDLTLRALQNKLKDNHLPWSMAKAFDGSCPLTPFIPREKISDLLELRYQLTVNGKIQQVGEVNQMLFPPEQLLSCASQYFTLLPGDVIFTGTPVGVGPLSAKDEVSVSLHYLEQSILEITTEVI